MEAPCSIWFASGSIRLPLPSLGDCVIDLSPLQVSLCFSGDSI